MLAAHNVARRRWCFRCRRRAAHWLTLLVGDWYEPVALWICERCGGDHTAFPA